MKCIKCGCSVFERMLRRTEPKGQSNMGNMCMPCIEKYEPELARNIKSDISYTVIKNVEESARD